MIDNETSQEKKVAQKGTRKKEKPTKEKKIIPKYYAGTNITKLPKIPKTMLKDIEEVQLLTGEQLEKYLTAMAMGLIPDRFGLEASFDSRIKAFKELINLQNAKQLQTKRDDEAEQITNATEIVFRVKQADAIVKPVEEEEVEDADTGISNTSE